jgi:hypothetical protein
VLSYLPERPSVDRVASLLRDIGFTDETQVNNPRKVTISCAACCGATAEVDPSITSGESYQELPYPWYVIVASGGVRSHVCGSLCAMAVMQRRVNSAPDLREPGALARYLGREGLLADQPPSVVWKGNRRREILLGEAPAESPPASAPDETIRRPNAAVQSLAERLKRAEAETMERPIAQAVDPHLPGSACPLCGATRYGTGYCSCCDNEQLGGCTHGTRG